MRGEEEGKEIKISANMRLGLSVFGDFFSFLMLFLRFFFSLSLSV